VLRPWRSGGVLVGALILRRILIRGGRHLGGALLVDPGLALRVDLGLTPVLPRYLTSD
jgi:hypothetical protein